MDRSNRGPVTHLGGTSALAPQGDAEVTARAPPAPVCLPARSRRPRVQAFARCAAAALTVGSFRTPGGNVLDVGVRAALLAEAGTVRSLQLGAGWAGKSGAGLGRAQSIARAKRLAGSRLRRTKRPGGAGQQTKPPAKAPGSASSAGGRPRARQGRARARRRGAMEGAAEGGGHVRAGRAAGSRVKTPRLWHCKHREPGAPGSWGVSGAPGPGAPPPRSGAPEPAARRRRCPRRRAATMPRPGV
jgi:hypothetical protein